ncbi:beta-lactamase family protein [Paenibacillus sp. TRM 82003]|uniref:serine hydrolase domain-containing protein n=1 Tax=Kineococcus sp. TRM81007 TaxID=2925831 RepID=UPI001F5681CC|nr:serine hydrolase [Kineococcus sp. TRM81007]MCI2239326.1 beta-lactamase family protein [Kineococcus sp. TRM81007]MCI3925010.1 beta-lactamase family protein [Paenibacillus sp. TRM 82003]
MSTDATTATGTGGELPRSAPSALGVDARGVAAFLDAVEAADGVELHSLAVLRSGAVVAEGWWEPYAPDRLHLLYSVSKSFTATALGLAVAEGLVDLDSTVLSHFPELDADVTDERSRSITLRHVAAMASGHRGETIGAASADPTGDVVRGFLRLPPEGEPGTVFAYNQPCTFAIAAVVQRATGGTLTRYLRPRVLDPLGIGETAWLTDAHGREVGFSGLHATTDALAKLGQLHLGRGRWGEEQLLPAEWVDEVGRSHVDTCAAHPDPDWQLGYGYQFWPSRHGYRADGAYGQFALVLPEQDAVVAITGQTVPTQVLLEAVWEHLVPALSGPPLPPDAAAHDAALAARLRGLRLDVPPSSGPVREPEPALLTAAPSSAPATLARVRLERAAAGWSLVLEDGEDRLAAALGDGWRTTGALATSWAWTGPRSLRVDVVFVETPHRLVLELDVAAGTFRGTWRTEPLHAPPLARMRAPRP